MQTSLLILPYYHSKIQSLKIRGPPCLTGLKHLTSPFNCSPGQPIEDRDLELLAAADNELS